MADQLPALPQTAKTYLNRTTVIYGPSRTGKTTLANRIRELLKPHVGSEIIVAPTGGYPNDTAVLKAPQFADEDSKEFLKQIVEGQTDSCERLLLIFDDCMRCLRPYFNSENFRRLFYQDRHLGVTMIICCQDDTDISLNLRKNAQQTIYLDREAALGAINRLSELTRPTKERAHDICSELFAGSTYAQLAYKRCEQTFYRIESA